MFFTKAYWGAFLAKLFESLISVKLWIILIATFFAYRMLNICVDIKKVAIELSQDPNTSNELIRIFSHWSTSILDTTLAMFTGVIVVITISREAFKHAKIDKFYIKEYSEDEKDPDISKAANMVQKIKDRMI